ncbi:Pkinase-domain-containing protein [Xylariaceae sp. FL0594]|nr:Pkinase-domain-containing protein [Xylariaceae sp. FL0594]
MQPPAADPVDGAAGVHPQSMPVSPSSPLTSPRPWINVHESPEIRVRPPLDVHRSAPAPLQFTSPLRHHRRTPSQHREIKETLDAKYINDESDGQQNDRINQYILKEEIGRGSYASVHRAVDQFGNEYAIKKFSKSRLRRRAQSNILRRPGPGQPHQGAPGNLKLFYRNRFGQQEDAEAKDALYLIRAEVAIMKKLNHQNLVALYEVLDDPDDDSLYMVLEMCKKGVVMKVGLGPDGQAPPLDTELCRLWFRDLILGIEYLHAQGIIHRDIKPDNLLLTEDDVLKIVDFGVSEMFQKQDEMMTSKSAGSPAFIAPELCQARHGEVSGKAADVWSMGVTLYCLKYGKLPFNGDTPLDIYAAIRDENFTLPEDEDPSFVDLITRILDKNSATRITLPEIRNHPWVTRDGSDPLLSEEENCSDVVETPNELEVNHAFTQKMNHLFYVIRAIHKFKNLISQSRVSTPRLPYVPKPLVRKARVESLDGSSSMPQSSDVTPPNRQKSVAEEAAELVEQRKAYLRSGNLSLGPPFSRLLEDNEASDRGGKARIILSIGTGGHDEFSTDEPPANTVSESPTRIEFDVYDRAFETEIQRIRSDRKRNRARTYMTKLVGEKEKVKYAGDDCMIVEAGKSLAAGAYSHGSSAVSKGLSHLGSHGEDADAEEGEGNNTIHKVIEGASEQASKLADLARSVPKSLKEKATGAHEHEQ